jgi:hypothetical protein
MEMAISRTTIGCSIFSVHPRLTTSNFISRGSLKMIDVRATIRKNFGDLLKCGIFKLITLLTIATERSANEMKREMNETISNTSKAFSYSL